MARTALRVLAQEDEHARHQRCAAHGDGYASKHRVPNLLAEAAPLLPQSVAFIEPVVVLPVVPVRLIRVHDARSSLNSRACPRWMGVVWEQTIGQEWS